MDSTRFDWFIRLDNNTAHSDFVEQHVLPDSNLLVYWHPNFLVADPADNDGAATVISPHGEILLPDQWLEHPGAFGVSHVNSQGQLMTFDQEKFLSGWPYDYRYQATINWWNLDYAGGQITLLDSLRVTTWGDSLDYGKFSMKLASNGDRTIITSGFARYSNPDSAAFGQRYIVVDDELRQIVHEDTLSGSQYTGTAIPIAYQDGWIVWQNTQITRLDAGGVVVWNTGLDRYYGNSSWHDEFLRIVDDTMYFVTTSQADPTWSHYRWFTVDLETGVWDSVLLYDGDEYLHGAGMIIEGSHAIILGDCRSSNGVYNRIIRTTLDGLVVQNSLYAELCFAPLFPLQSGWMYTRHAGDAIFRSALARFSISGGDWVYEEYIAMPGTRYGGRQRPYFLDGGFVSIHEEHMGGVEIGLFANRYSPPALTVNSNSHEKKSVFSLYPNPANGSVRLVFTLAKTAVVSFKLYNLQGQLALRESFDSVSAGEFSTLINMEDLAGGLYLIDLNLDGVSVANSKLLYLP